MMREKLQKIQVKRLGQIKDPGCTGIAWEKAWSRDLA